MGEYIVRLEELGDRIELRETPFGTQVFFRGKKLERTPFTNTFELDNLRGRVYALRLQPRLGALPRVFVDGEEHQPTPYDL